MFSSIIQIIVYVANLFGKYVRLLPLVIKEFNMHLGNKDMHLGNKVVVKFFEHNWKKTVF